MKKTLAVGSGALYGAYSAGVLAEFARELGGSYFDQVLASSVSVCHASFFVAGQDRVIENTWRNLVHGKRVFNPWRFWGALKLHYLESIFQDERSLLDVETLFTARTRLMFTLTRYPTGEVVYRMPTRDNIFRAMSAACGVPILHGPVRLGEEAFVDGTFNDPLPVARALVGGADFVVAVTHRLRDQPPDTSHHVFRFVTKVLPPEIQRLIAAHSQKMRELEELLQRESQRVLVVRPTEPLPLRGPLDTNQARLSATVDQGIADARRALRFFEAFR